MTDCDIGTMLNKTMCVLATETPLKIVTTYFLRPTFHVEMWHPLFNISLVQRHSKTSQKMSATLKNFYRQTNTQQKTC